ncbi:hypothetical protein GCM10029964_092380 [Kibdelosporangium lantanae]
MAGSDFGPGFSVGQRIQYFRNRAGMSRPILAGLVGKSAEWLKGVENGRLQTPRLTVLLLIARALELDDLSDLTGDGIAVPVRVFAGERHTALSAVQAALTDYRIFPTSVSPLSVNHLALRLQQAWTVRHSSSDHRTQLGALLPDLIRDAQTAVRTVGEEDRRAAHRVLAGVYRLTDFYVAYQPAPELVWMVADRALMEAELADDPYAIAGVPGQWCRHCERLAAGTKLCIWLLTVHGNSRFILTVVRTTGAACGALCRLRSRTSTPGVVGTGMHGRTGNGRMR